MRPGTRSKAPASSTKPRERRSRWLTVGVAVVAAIVGLVIGLVIGLAIANKAPEQATARGVELVPTQAADGWQEVVFVLEALDATSVSVLGDFNLWEPTALSDSDGDGIWKTSLILLPGRYEYAFVIDGSWRGHDPLADEYIRSFGDYSSVRYIRGGSGA